MISLIIVESPTKARTLSRFLGSEFVVDSTMGHIRDLPKSKIGVDVEHDFEPTFELDSKKSAIILRIKKEVKLADKVYLATDPDREGEAIAWHASNVLRSNKKLKTENEKFSRVTFHEITESAVKGALAHPRALDMNLVDAQQARRVLDRLVGYKLSPLLWKKVRRGLSAGRVQSVAVRLIVEKEREIEAFLPQEYWDIWADVSKVSNKESFSVKLVKICDVKAEVKNSEQTEKIVADLQNSTFNVESVVRKEVVRRPCPPFTTSTLTQAASRTHYWSAKKTMSVAQKLYEEGLITYHRTDSTHLALQSIEAVRDYIKSQFDSKYLPDKLRFYKTLSKVAQEAHEAIRPTNVAISSQQFPVSKELSKDAQLLYGLIWRRFVSCQMSDALYDETRIDVKAAGGKDISLFYILRASGQILKFPGWKVLYKNSKAEEDIVQLPEVFHNEPLQLIKVNSQQKFTEPPARYTEASLVKTLEKLGIGRPSTYAPTISTIQDRQYVEKNVGKFKPSLLGLAVNDFLITNFKDIFDYNFTAKMEGDLDEIAQGEKQWVPVISDFWKPFSKKLEGVEESAKRVKIEVEKTGKKCPLCGEGDEVIRVGRFGKFLSCSRFPDCKHTAPFVEKIEMKCPTCKTSDVVIKKTRRGKKFFGCANYPKCKWASWKKPEVMPVLLATPS